MEFEGILNKNLKKKQEKQQVHKIGWYLLKNVMIYGSKVLGMDFDEQDYYRTDEIRKISQKISNDLFKDKKPAMIGVSIKYENIGWRSGKLTDVGDPVKLFNPSESDINYDIGKILKFKLILISKPQADMERLEKVRALKDLKKFNKK